MTDGRVALVTGGNGGIGLAVVRALAERGITVWLASRDPARGAAAAASVADAGDVRPVTIDLTDPAGFTPALDAIAAAHGRLDILVNNAALALPGTVFDVDPETVRLSFETNLHGPQRLTQLAIPLLRRSPAARIVNVSSGAGQFAQLSGSRFAPATALPYGYCVAKAALNAWTVMLAAALADEGIKVNACNPGHVNSGISRFTGTRTPAKGARIIVDLATAGPDGSTGGFFDENGPLDW